MIQKFGGAETMTKYVASKVFYIHDFTVVYIHITHIYCML